MIVNTDERGLPKMQGENPFSKVFNERVQKLAQEGRFLEYSEQAITLVILELLIDDYNERNETKKKKK